jgi:hypothetical protein
MAANDLGPHVGQFVRDFRMRAMAAGAAEVWFRGIYTNSLRATLRQRECQHTRTAAHVEDAAAPLDAGKLQERARQARAPSPHEVLVDIRIGRLELGH